MSPQGAAFWRDKDQDKVFHSALVQSYCEGEHFDSLEQGLLAGLGVAPMAGRRQPVAWGWRGGGWQVVLQKASPPQSIVLHSADIAEAA